MSRWPCAALQEAVDWQLPCSANAVRFARWLSGVGLPTKGGATVGVVGVRSSRLCGRHVRSSAAGWVFVLPPRSHVPRCDDESPSSPRPNPIFTAAVGTSQKCGRVIRCRRWGGSATYQVSCPGLPRLLFPWPSQLPGRAPPAHCICFLGYGLCSFRLVDARTCLGPVRRGR